MSLKIKMFSSTHNNLSSIENEVNSWISLNPEFNFKDIKVTYSDHNVLITLLYESAGKTARNDLMPVQTQSFKETLTTVNQEEPSRPIIPMPKNQTTSVQKQPTPEDLAAALDDIGQSFVKPGRLIQNNYSKYSKNNQKISEDQAFNWD